VRRGGPGRHERGVRGRRQVRGGPGNGRARAVRPGSARQAAGSGRGRLCGPRAAAARGARPMTGPAGVAGPARIVLATRNPGKLAELRRILAAAGVSAAVTDLDDVPGMPEVAETGRSFTENALLKARAVAAFTGLPAVAADPRRCVG